jgi:8-oxo-dGTP pyrophosphatase MutT (NUDIX family)
LASAGLLTLDLVRRALRLPLPGADAHAHMAPRPRNTALPAPPQYRDGAVLLLLYPHNGALHIALTRRCDHLAAHAGQISFPGGLREPTDRSFVEAALRETREELGLEPGELDLLGQLTPVEIAVSGYRIHPCAAWSRARPSFRPDPCEVAELLEVPLAHLLNPATAKVELRTIRGHEVDVPFYHVGRYKVWGATAMVLSELVTLVRQAQEAI